MSTDSNVNNAKRDITRFECNVHTRKTFILETGNVKIMISQMNNLLGELKKT